MAAPKIGAAKFLKPRELVSSRGRFLILLISMVFSPQHKEQEDLSMSQTYSDLTTTKGKIEHLRETWSLIESIDLSKHGDGMADLRHAAAQKTLRIMQLLKAGKIEAAHTRTAELLRLVKRMEIFPMSPRQQRRRS